MGEESTIKVVDVDKVDDARLFFVFWSVSGQTQWSVPSVAHKDKGKKEFRQQCWDCFHTVELPPERNYSAYECLDQNEFQMKYYLPRRDSKVKLSSFIFDKLKLS